MSAPDPVAFFNDWYFTTNKTENNCPGALPCPPPSKACARDPTNGSRYCCDGQPDAKSKVGRVCWKGPTDCKTDGSTVDCSNGKRAWCCLSGLEKCSQTPNQDAAICWSTRHDPLYNVTYNDLDRLHSSLSAGQPQANTLAFDVVSLISATATAPFATASSAPSTSASTSTAPSSSSTTTASTSSRTAPAEASSPAQPAQGSSSGVSGGAIAGIVVGAVAGIALVALAVFFLLKRKKNNNSAAAAAAELGGGPAPTSATAVPGELGGEGYHTMRSELPVEEPQELPGSYGSHTPGGGGGAPYSAVSSTTAGFHPSPYSEASMPMR
ncbi:hypothetical protein MAPG_02062 [Magnaporthiopsis poae ATCC 64411]|uniref:Mid2 domain-containing protein n=1 Tax=Magnaporthiopsis poae (strain ATCC 64411 / 73-15) TaxID=644358 RepID=A0A0C4DQC3_MAGP6|nr:hypothetical protein MAPG_02062 [Magnaporthiopsis poae ATCC 64411]